MSTDAEQRELAAIMFTDMVGYSELSQRDDKLALELLEEHRALLRSIFPKFHGTEIKAIGDAFLVEFNSALEAAQCAIEIQRTLAHRDADAPADRQIQLRIGFSPAHRGAFIAPDEKGESEIDCRKARFLSETSPAQRGVCPSAERSKIACRRFRRSALAF